MDEAVRTKIKVGVPIPPLREGISETAWGKGNGCLRYWKNGKWKSRALTCGKRGATGSLSQIRGWDSPNKHGRKRMDGSGYEENGAQLNIRDEREVGPKEYMEEGRYYWCGKKEHWGNCRQCKCGRCSFQGHSSRTCKYIMSCAEDVD